MKLAPTPAKAASLTRTRITAALKRAGRKRGIESHVERLREAFRTDSALQPELVEDTLGKQTLALLGQLTAACTAADDLAQAVEEAFPQHPDSDIILSFPGLDIPLAARVLAEIGDDRTRFADARGLKAYAGASPVTRASGKKSSITRRWVKNDRLNHAGYLWAFSASTASPGTSPTTGGDVTTTGTGMPLASAICSTGYWASPTTASRTVICSMNAPRSRRRRPQHWRWRR